MRSILVLLTAVFTLGLSAQAQETQKLSPKSLKIQKAAEELGKLALGSKTFQVSGKSPSEILIKHLGDEYENPEYLENKEFDQIRYMDELNYGTTSMRSAIAMGAFAGATFDEQLNQLAHNEGSEAEIDAVLQKRAALDKNWAPTIKKTIGTGVVFGYSGYGPGYCDVSFTKMILIDVKAGLVYEIYFSKAEDC